MSDDLGRDLGAWLHAIDAGPSDPGMSLRRTMANVALTSQVSPSRLAAVLSREVIPTEPTSAPAAHHHATPIETGRSDHATTGGTNRMLITATATAVISALVLGSAMLMSGLVAGPTPPPIGATQEPTSESQSPLVGSQTVADDRFELTITTPRTTWLADEPIEVEATLAYIGEDPEAVVWSTFDIVVFGIEQLDGPIDNGGVRRMVCAGHGFTSGDVETIPFQKSGAFGAEGEMADFWRSWFDDPELRLPAGMYRVIASAEHGPSCGEISTLDAAVTIEVVADVASETGIHGGPLGGVTALA